MSTKQPTFIRTRNTKQSILLFTSNFGLQKVKRRKQSFFFVLEDL